MIYICYGITKSASTFLYQLTEETFRAAGRKIMRLGSPYRASDSVENYFDFVNIDLLSEIQDLAKGRDIVLKTHGPPLAGIAELVASGHVLASSSIRDPREIALSMIDHGHRSRQWKSARFSEFVHVDDTLNALDIQIGIFQSWANIKGVKIFKYNDICYDSASVVTGIASHIGAEVDADKVLNKFKSKTTIGQFSKGKALRYTELSSEDQEIFLERYADLYKAFEFETANARRVAEEQKGRALRPSGELIQHLINFRRRFRI
ncbi:hypothetical protein SAMN05216304_103486 [Bosea sp. OK403]|uniref:hypothetical protein n=1 Tax=Bosea sp. OK403 TaxID=1855286 RepID=UPI0008F41A45|nr:hypothetical protein [Bosea sp. OK403]SFI78067.1 hypothetical protein SAMN05216304_103486 [Bosea sp. OK403]